MVEKVAGVCAQVFGKWRAKSLEVAADLSPRRVMRHDRQDAARRETYVGRRDAARREWQTRHDRQEAARRETYHGRGAARRKHDGRDADRPTHD